MDVDGRGDTQSTVATRKADVLLDECIARTGPSSRAQNTRTRAHRIEVVNAQTDAALASYESTVLTALEEIEDALVAFGDAQERNDILARASASSAKAARLARQRFEGRLTDFLDVLDAEGAALDAQDSLAERRTQAATAMVAIYKAPGGGWTN